MRYKTDINDIRNQLKLGDVLVSRCDDLGSRLGIMFAGKDAAVGHCGLVISPEYYIESFFSFDRKKGHGIWVRSIDDYLKREQYVWCLMLSGDFRQKLDIKQGAEFLFGTAVKYKYSIVKVMKLILWQFFHPLLPLKFFFNNKSSSGNMICSELVACFYKKCGIDCIDNCSVVLPVDISRWRIFQDEYYQLKGRKEELAGFNSVKTGFCVL